MRRSRRGNVPVAAVARTRNSRARQLLLRAVRMYVYAPQYLRVFCWGALVRVLRAFLAPAGLTAFLAARWTYPELKRRVASLLNDLDRRRVRGGLRGRAHAALIDALPAAVNQ